MSAKSRPGARNANWRGGKSLHPLYDIYHDMIGRCQRPIHHAYDRYGGRGITVCDRWRADFWAFVADMGERPTGHSLDRINNDGPYSAENCRWATAVEQRRNRRPQRLPDACGKGHPYIPGSFQITPDGKRRCRSCARQWAVESRARRAAA